MSMALAHGGRLITLNAEGRVVSVEESSHGVLRKRPDLIVHEQSLREPKAVRSSGIDRDYERRLEGFEAWFFDKDRVPQGVDRLVLDIAFKAGWEAAKGRGPKKPREKS